MPAPCPPLTLPRTLTRFLPSSPLSPRRVRSPFYSSLIGPPHPSFLCTSRCSLLDLSFFFIPFTICTSSSSLLNICFLSHSFLTFSHCLAFPFVCCSSPSSLLTHSLVLCSPLLPSFLSSLLPSSFRFCPQGFFACLTHSFALTDCVYIDILFSVCGPGHRKPESSEARRHLQTAPSSKHK